MIKIEIKNLGQLTKYLEKRIDDALNDIADEVGAKSDAILRDNDFKVGSFNNGDLARSLVIDKDKPLIKEVGYEAFYACIVGSKSQIRVKNKKSNNINTIKIDDEILCKDGKYHKVVRKINELTVSVKPNLVLLQCEKTRTKNGLLITDDHLVLTCKDNYIYWEESKNLKIGDIVFKPKKIPHNKGNIKMVERICINCNEIFNVNINDLKYRVNNYCSTSCYHKHTSHDRNKGKTWKLTKEQRLNKSGENNPAWKGGISKLPYGIGWNKILKEFIKERDNYTCQLCCKLEDEYEYSFHVHHIDGNKFNNDISNLVTLCPSCHGKQQFRDAELVSINLEVFEPIKLIKVKKIYAPNYFTKKGAMRKVKLYDLQVKNENSFVAMGIVVHNSYIEYGTSPHFPPIDVIYEWVRKKQNDIDWVQPSGKIYISPKTEIEYDSGLLKAAYSIINHIGNEGTEAKPFIRPALEYGRSRTKSILKENLERENN